MSTFGDAIGLVRGRITGLTFGGALAHLKRGDRVARAGWNGKGMWLALENPSHSAEGAGENTKMTLPFIYMSTVTGHLVPWLASQTDMLAEDWEVL